MKKFGNFLFLLWICLAIACFVGAFFITPIWVKVISVIFGIINISVIMCWAIAFRVERKAYKNNKVGEE